MPNLCKKMCHATAQSAPHPQGIRRFAIGAGGRFFEMRAGILKRDSKLEQKTSTRYFFGRDETETQTESQWVKRSFSGVRVPKDPAQEMIFGICGQVQNRQLEFLSWYGEENLQGLQGGGNGFMCTVLLAVESDGTGTGTAEGISFSLTECGKRRQGNVWVDKNGLPHFAPNAIWGAE